MDGQQNELKNRRNTEQESKLVKNRNKISTKHTDFKEELRCLAKAPQNYPCLRRTSFLSLQSVISVNPVKKTTRSYALFHNTNFGINPKGEVKHFKKWPDSSPEAA